MCIKVCIYLIKTSLNMMWMIFHRKFEKWIHMGSCDVRYCMNIYVYMYVCVCFYFTLHRKKEKRKIRTKIEINIFWFSKLRYKNDKMTCWLTVWLVLWFTEILIFIHPNQAVCLAL